MPVLFNLVATLSHGQKFQEKGCHVLFLLYVLVILVLHIIITISSLLHYVSACVDLATVSTSSLNKSPSIAFCRSSSKSSFDCRHCFIPASLRSLFSTTGSVVRGVPTLPCNLLDSKYVVMAILAGMSMGNRRM